MNSLGSALKNKMGKTTDATGARKAIDYITGTRRVDNAKNPASGYSVAKRKERSTIARNKQY